MSWLSFFEAVGLSWGSVVTLGVNLAIQSSLLIALGLLLSRVVRGRGAAIESVLLRATLAAVIMCPAAALLLNAAGVHTFTIHLPRPYENPAAEFETPTAGAPVEPDRLEAAALENAAISELPADVAAVDSGREFAGGTEPVAVGQDALPDALPAEKARVDYSLLGVVYGVLAVIWLAVSACLVGRLFVLHLRLLYIKRFAPTADAEAVARWRAMADYLQVKTPALVCTPAVVSPCLTGIFRPAALLPADSGCALSASREVILHELAHLVRRDCLWLMLSKLTAAVLFFQPLIWVLARLNEQAAEDVCDDYVVRHSPDRQTYANQLVDIAEHYLPGRLEANTGLGVIRFRSALGRRVYRIMDTGRKLSTGAGRRAVVAVAAIAVLATFVSGLIAVTGSKAEIPPDEPAAEESSWEDSRAWYILRQTDTTGLLHGLPQRLGKAIVPSKRQTPMWQGVDDGGSIDLQIKVEGDVTGEIFVGFFSDARWWAAPPVQVRCFPGPGRYTADNLIPGKYYVGAMTGSLPVPDVLGVNRSWPAPIEILEGKTLSVDLLVSTEFKDRLCHPHQYEGFAGQFGPMDPARMITVRTVDQKGSPAPFCRVTYRDRDPSSRDPFHDIGSDEQGYSYCGKMDGPFSLTSARYDFVAEQFAQRWQFRRFEDVHNTADRKVITVQWPSYPTGTGKVKGRVHDQYGQPLTAYYLTVKQDQKGSNQSKEEHIAFGYKAPITDSEGRFEIENLAPGKYTVMVRAFDYPTHAWDFDMGQFTIADEDNAVTEFNLEVEAKELLYGRAVYEDDSPLEKGGYTVWFEDYARVRQEGAMALEHFSLSADAEARFRVCLSRKERKDLLKYNKGEVFIHDASGDLGRIHIDKLSKDANNPAKVVFPRPKAEPSEASAAESGPTDESSNTTEEDSEEVLGLGEGLGEQQYSRAWYILRQWNVGPLLLGLTQQLGKVIEPSRRSEDIWTGANDEGSLTLDIKAEGETPGEIFVGFFDDATWSRQPLQVRSFPGPGQYIVKNLPYGTFTIGAMIGEPPVAQALGVHRRWPEPVLVQRGVIGAAQVLVSPEFQKRASGFENEQVARDYIGQWKEMDPGNLLRGRVIGPDGRAAAYAHVSLHEYKGKPSSYAMSHSATNEEGYFYIETKQWPYRISVEWQEKLPALFGTRRHFIFQRKVLRGAQNVNFKFDVFDGGSSVLRGRIVDQDGDPVREFHLVVQTKIDYADWYKDAEGDYRSTGYHVPFVSETGSFELPGLPAGIFEARAIPFDVQSYEMDRGTEVELQDSNTTEITLTLTAKNALYGRVLFDDGRAPDPQHIRLSMATGRRGIAKRVGSFDDEGYFTVHFSDSELEQLRSGGVSLRVSLRHGDKRHSAGTFGFELLSAERDNAGVLKIERPGAGGSEPNRPGGPSAPEVSLQTGRAAVEPFALLDTDGHTHRLSDYKGKVVLLNIFTTWCGPCEMERPHLKKLHSEYADKGLVILGISRKEKPDTVESWARKNRLPFPVLVDEAGHAIGQFGDEKGRVPVPTNVVLDRQHRITRSSAGFSEELFAALKAAVSLAIEQK